jgi:23S rRNA (pseudouridine1915-N3)-methyltransferase
MRITIAAAGRLRGGPEKLLCDQYLKRMTWPVEIREIEEKRKLPPDQLRQREAGLLLGCCPDGSVIVALDEKGTQKTSREFATALGRWRDDGESNIAFVIGGAGGLDPDVICRARLRLSFGRMTYPHMLMRGVLLEQIYRAQQILAGHPYHRD